MKPHLKLFISAGDVSGAFGSGKFHLLKAIKENGSIQKAAKSLNRSYRKAWGDIKRAEEGFGKSLVIKSRGGSDGGRTKLTDFGNELLSAWEDFKDEIYPAMITSFEKHFKHISEPDKNSENS